MDGAYRVPPDRVRVDILVPGDGRWMWVGVWVALGGGRVTLVGVWVALGGGGVDVGGGLGGS